MDPRVPTLITAADRGGVRSGPAPRTDRCERCGDALAYPGARFCGAACSQQQESE